MGSPFRESYSAAIAEREKRLSELKAERAALEREIYSLSSPSRWSSPVVLALLCIAILVAPFAGAFAGCAYGTFGGVPPGVPTCPRSR
jgi:hypothetical protein